MTVSSKAGRYELQQELGRGAMGVVYLAFDPVIGRTVAVKTVQLTAEGAGVSHAELLTRFQTEARAAGLLAHPNIVVVYDAGEDDGRFYITMELVEGRSLQEQMNLRQPFPLPRVMRWMQQACSALEFAHQHCVIHRDIKPANLMLTSDDTLKITDFGTAKILQLNTTQTAHVIGTPNYMSPEQIKGKPVDGRTDVFSLGVVLYELLTGAKPFTGESVTSVIYKVVNEDPVPPRDMDSTIHPGLSAVVQRALAKSPYARFQSCRDFAEALQNYQDFEVPRAARAAAAVPAAEPVPVRAPLPTVPTGTWAEDEETVSERNNGSFALIALVLVAIIAGAGYRVYPAMREIWQRSHTTTPAAVATIDTTSTDNAPVDAGATDQTVATPVAPAAVSAPAPAHVPTQNPSQVPVPVATSQDASSTEITATSVAQSQQLETVSKPPAIRKSGAPKTSQVAAEWKDLIEAKLSSANLGSDVHVVAAGNSVTLTGKLDPAAHTKLLGQLQFVPAGLQIIDDIEYTGEPTQQTPR